MNGPITTRTFVSKQHITSNNEEALGKLRLLPVLEQAKKLGKGSSKAKRKRNYDSLAISQARQAIKHTLRNIEIYLTLQEQQLPRRRPGLHRNGDGSVILVDASGLIQSFTTAPTEEFAEGLAYTNIRYDSDGRMISCETPWHSTFQRSGPTDVQGIGAWINTRDELPMQYIGADASTWFGVMSVDEFGFHSYVASGRYDQVLYTRAGDSSLCRTRPRIVDGVTIGLETITTLPDKSRVAHQVRFLGERAVFEKAVEVFDIERTNKHTVEVDELNAVFQVVDATEISENFNLGAVMKQLIANGLSAHDLTSDTTQAKPTSELR